MLKLLKGETGNKSTDVDGNLAVCVHKTVHKSLSKDVCYQLNWTLDFSNMTQDQIVEAAAEHFIIKIRRSFGKCDKPENDDWNNVTFDVSKYIKTRTSKIDRMVKTLADFSDEQLAEMGLVRAESE